MRKEFYVDVNNTSLQVATIGEGHPIFVIHGGPGGCHRIFGDYLDDLAKDYKLIYYDQRGQGTSKEEDVDSIKMEDLVSDLHELAKKMGHDEYALLGHSFGGFVALEYTLKYPKNVTNLILMNTADTVKGLHEFRVESFESASPEYQELFNQHVAELMKSRELYEIDHEQAQRIFKDAYKLILVEESLDLSKEEILKFHDVIDNTVFNLNFAFSDTSTLLVDFDVTDRIDDIKTSTLIITGDREHTLNPMLSVQMSKKMANSKLVVYENVGHNSYVERPEDIIKRIREHISYIGNDE